MNSTYLKSLGHEYLETIRMVRSGMYSGEEIQDLENQRCVLHQQILQLLKKDVPKDEMPAYVRNFIL